MLHGDPPIYLDLATIKTLLASDYWESETPLEINSWVRKLAHTAQRALEWLETPIPMILHCPYCYGQHIDEPEPQIGWTNPPHRTHLCHGCKRTWRPADVETTGVRELPRAGRTA